MRFFWIVLDFFLFFSMLLKLLLNTKNGKNSIQKSFVCPKKASVIGRSPPQELEVSPCSGLYLLVNAKNILRLIVYKRAASSPNVVSVQVAYQPVAMAVYTVYTEEQHWGQLCWRTVFSLHWTATLGPVILADSVQCTLDSNPGASYTGRQYTVYTEEQHWGQLYWQTVYNVNWRATLGPVLLSGSLHCTLDRQTGASYTGKAGSTRPQFLSTWATPTDRGSVVLPGPLGPASLHFRPQEFLSVLNRGIGISYCGVTATEQKGIS